MPQICKQALERPICMLLGEELGNSTVPFGNPLFYSLVTYYGQSELSVTQGVCNHYRVFYIMLAPEIVWSREMILHHSRHSIRLCVCCWYLRQYIFKYHSSIFSADVALDKHCMTSSQKFWQRTKLPQGHWLLLFTDSSLLCKFVCSLSSFSGPVTHSDMEQITLS